MEGENIILTALMLIAVVALNMVLWADYVCSIGETNLVPCYDGHGHEILGKECIDKGEDKFVGCFLISIVSLIVLLFFFQFGYLRYVGGLDD